MEKIATKTITEALALAMENADRMQRVVVLYETVESDSKMGGMIANDDATLAQINYLLDKGKQWIFE